jgi:hypothetical protein
MLDHTYLEPPTLKCLTQKYSEYGELSQTDDIGGLEIFGDLPLRHFCDGVVIETFPDFINICFNKTQSLIAFKSTYVKIRGYFFDSNINNYQVYLNKKLIKFVPDLEKFFNDNKQFINPDNNVITITSPNSNEMVSLCYIITYPVQNGKPVFFFLEKELERWEKKSK